jgi:hypothetical protein
VAGRAHLGRDDAALADVGLGRHRRGLVCMSRGGQQQTRQEKGDSLHGFMGFRWAQLLNFQFFRANAFKRGDRPVQNMVTTTESTRRFNAHNVGRNYLVFVTFAKHTDVFKGYKYEIVPSTEKNGTPTLVVKSKKKQLTIKPFTNLIQTGKKGTETIKLNSVVVYVDKNNTFYLPSDLAKHL